MDQVHSIARNIANRSLSTDVRRDAYSQLISFSKSEASDVKKLVGISIPACFAEFTTLQEEAVDAVYDLCEDVDKEVRIVGYKTFEQISRKVVAWVKRNTDVLIQLLQVETEDELRCIRELLLSHIRISPAPALSVIFDNLCSPDAEVRRKETLLDILEVEGKTWIARECVPLQASGQESENGQLLREGLEQVLSSSPPAALLLKIYGLLAQLPFTSSSLPTSLLLYRPAAPEIYDLALKCYKQPDVRAIVLNWFESGGAAHKLNGEVEEAREFLKWVRKWREAENSGKLERQGPLKWEGETLEVTVERWRKVEAGLVSQAAVRVVGHWGDLKPSNGKTARPIPFPLMEPLLLTLANLSEIHGVDTSRITVPTFEFCRHLVDQPHDSSWPRAVGATKKMQDNYNQLLSWFRGSRNTPIPSIEPSWELQSSSATHTNGDSRQAPQIRSSVSSSIALPPPAKTGINSLPPRPSNGLSRGSAVNAPLVVEPMKDSRAEEERRREDRKRKFAAETGSTSFSEQPSKRAAAPEPPSRSKGHGSSRRRRSSSASSGMDGIEVISAPSNSNSSGPPSLLTRITSTTIKGSASRGRESPSYSSSSWNRSPSPPRRRAPSPARRASSPPPAPNTLARQPPPHLLPRNDSSSARPHSIPASSASSSIRERPLPPITSSVSGSPAPSRPAVGLRNPSGSAPIHPPPEPQQPLYCLPHLQGLPFHPDNKKARAMMARSGQSIPTSSGTVLHPPPRQQRHEEGPDLIASLEGADGTSREGGVGGGGAGMGWSIRGRAKARAPPPPQPVEEDRREDRREEKGRGEGEGAGGGGGRLGLLARMQG